MECPCCENETLHGRDSCEICPVCFWEDDPCVQDNLYIKSDCNKGLTILEAREHYEKWGAVDTNGIKHTVSYEVFKLQNGLD